MNDMDQEILEIIEVLEQDADWLSPWERSFITDLKAQGIGFTERQYDKLTEIHKCRCAALDADENSDWDPPY